MKILLIAPIGDFKIEDGGYGNASLGLLSVLKKMSDKNYIRKVDVVSTLNFKDLKIPKEEYDISILVSHPNSFNNKNTSNVLSTLVKRGRNKFLSIVWETDPLPSSWNWLWSSNLFSGFITPSNFVKSMIERVTSKKIYLVPHFLDVKKFEPRIKISDKEDEKSFTALFIGQYTKRKGLEDALLSFVYELGYNKNCKLILKYHDMSNFEIPIEDLIANILKTNTVGNIEAQIYGLNEKLDFEDMIDLYRQSSVLLFSSRGEGFGLPPAEAMCVGLPVIYTNWSATSEIADAGGNIAVDYTLDYSHGMAHHGYEKYSRYSVPKLESLCNALHNKYTLWKKDRKIYYKQVENNYKIIDEKFGYESIRDYIKEIINDCR